jgi:hypothetical protein
MIMARSPLAAWLATAVLVLAGSAAAREARASAIVLAELPQVQGPIPVTETSHPFLSDRAAMEAAGYVEEEYFLSGLAKVYEWAGKDRRIRAVAGPGRYVTRLLVRRPRDPARFSGNVEVGVLNASVGIDIGGPIDRRRMLSQGDVWIGVTTKAVAARNLKKIDPQRYAPLDWSSPVPTARRCEVPTIIPSFMYAGVDRSALKTGATASAPETEDGLVWDMLGQLGLLLKSPQRDKLLPGFGKPYLYMDGGSQSSLYIRTWAAAFHDLYRTADGKPVYDGYLAFVGPAMILLNQCAQDIQLADPRQRLQTLDAAFISLSSEGEIWQSVHTRQPDAVTPHGGMVTYEVAGGSHMGRDVPGLPNTDSMMESLSQAARAGIQMPQLGVGPGIPAAPPNDFIWAPILRGAYHNLQLWVRQGVPPPHAPGIEVTAAGDVKRDRYGNALGGLRTPYIDVPVASYTGYRNPPGGGRGLMGARAPLSGETLKALYPDHAAYSARFSAATDRVLAGRWISPEDAQAMKQAAAAASVP